MTIQDMAGVNCRIHHRGWSQILRFFYLHEKKEHIARTFL